MIKGYRRSQTSLQVLFPPFFLFHQGPKPTFSKPNGSEFEILPQHIPQTSGAGAYLTLQMGLEMLQLEGLLVRAHFCSKPDNCTQTCTKNYQSGTILLCFIPETSAWEEKLHLVTKPWMPLCQKPISHLLSVVATCLWFFSVSPVAPLQTTPGFSTPSQKAPGIFLRA